MCSTTLMDSQESDRYDRENGPRNAADGKRGSNWPVSTGKQEGPRIVLRAMQPMTRETRHPKTETRCVRSDDRSRRRVENDRFREHCEKPADPAFPQRLMLQGCDTETGRQRDTQETDNTAETQYNDGRCQHGTLNDDTLPK